MTPKVVVASLIVITLAVLGGLLNAATGAAVPPARLGTAGSFAILAGSTITNANVSTIEGDVGLSPGSAVTGFDPCTAPAPANCVALIGALQVANGVALQAKADLLTAYNNLLTLEGSCTELTNVELGGMTFLPGVYCSNTFGLSAGQTVTLDANGDPDAEFIFLTGAGGTTLITGAGSRVAFTDGAQACNAYFQVASSATVGVGTAFAGNILAAQSITVQQGASLEGRALAQNAAVTLDNNTITRADCETAVPPTTVPPTTVPPTTTTTRPVTTTTTVPATTTTTRPVTTTTAVPATTTTTRPVTTTTAVPATTTTTRPVTTTTAVPATTTTTRPVTTTTTVPATTSTTSAATAAATGIGITATGTGRGGGGDSLTGGAGGPAGGLARTGGRPVNGVLTGLALVIYGVGVLLASRRAARV